ncbi:trypsin-like peptidase domain-containing protein [Flavobacteriaceae bacterium]|nr:trypsin-like peptidase domain-containing protein [Flavobacteriaceae bacterium]MDA8757776.1 trypsin-like peptidase domain-containing protein [Flavobacteriaceae bacterium]MDA8763725.1 trypsin-like peptidase domain-containing protein [Flavobacteriaceae bacterium]
MKSTLKTLMIAAVSALVTLAAHDYFSKEKIEIVENEKPSLIPTTYSFNTNKVAAELTDFTRAAEKTVNAVVHVKNTSIQKGNVSGWLRQFYGDDYDEERIGTGSGVIVSPDGLIITNYHVIENASEIEVTSNKNKTYVAEIIGSDPSTDLAVLKIKSDESLPFIPFGDSEVARIGEWVLAVGNPFNLNSTVTAGIISAKSRDLNDRDSKNQSFIQTDAAVNMGNSGGALVNTDGELIGINTAISSITGGFVGYSFAVPSNIVRKVFEDLIEYGNVQKGLLGVSGSALNADLAEKFEVNETQGFLIGEVIDGMGASEAGLQSGDIIKKVDDVKINTFSDLTGYLSTKRPGEKVEVSYSRNDSRKKVTVTLKKTNSTQFLGMYLSNINDEQKEYFELDEGVIIKELRNQRLYRYGIDEGFVLLEINNKKIKDVGDVDAVDFDSLSSILFLKPNGERERIVFE